MSIGIVAIGNVLPWFQKYRQRSQDSCPKFGYRRPQITTHQSDYKQFQKAELPKSQFTGPDTKELIIKKLYDHFTNTIIFITAIVC